MDLLLLRVRVVYTSPLRSARFKTADFFISKSLARAFDLTARRAEESPSVREGMLATIWK